MKYYDDSSPGSVDEKPQNCDLNTLKTLKQGNYKHDSDRKLRNLNAVVVMG